jgi:hypothetical protein
MKSYIFLTSEGYTFQPDSESTVPDIWNCQVIGLARGIDEKDAFQNLINENPYLLDTNFDQLICLELKYIHYNKHKHHFSLASFKCNELTKKLADDYKIIISDIYAGGGATIDLYYDENTGRVKEEKAFADKTVLSFELDVSDFDPNDYGDKGVEFLNRINIV